MPAKEVKMSEKFGTDGIRGIANEDLTARTAFALGNALCRLKQNPKVVIGRDTRVSSDMFMLAVAAGITSGGGDVIDGGVIPTAATAFFVRKTGADFGVVISASHNPAKFNGLKVFDERGRKLCEKAERRAEKYFDEYAFSGSLSAGRFSPLFRKEDYTDFLVSCCGVSLKGKKFALDCANGAAGGFAAEVFERLGAKVVVCGIGRGGTDINDGCGALHPERVRALVKETGADAGFSYDGDADRLIACDEKGGLVDGDKILCVFAQEMKSRKTLKKDIVVGTTHTNTGAELALTKMGVRLIRTDIGDKYVAEAMEKSGAQIGGEQSGHIILSDYSTTGDGILTSVKLAELISEKRLSKLADIKLFPQCNASIKVKDKVRVLGDEMLREEIDRAREKVARLVVRASGTEPVIRIFAEAESLKTAKNAVEQVKRSIAASEEGYSAD